MADRKAIVILTHQRSGSKWLGHLIRDKFSIMHIGEIFSPDGDGLMDYRYYIEKIKFNDYLSSNKYNLLDIYFDKLHKYTGNALCFDLMFNQTDWISSGWNSNNKFIYEYIASRNFIVIDLRRSDIDIFVSMKALELSEHAHSFLDEQILPSSESPLLAKLGGAKIRLELSEFQNFRKSLAHSRHVMESHFLENPRFIQINYENLLNDKSLNAIEKKLRQEVSFWNDDLSIFFTRKILKLNFNYHEIFENIDEIANS